MAYEFRLGDTVEFVGHRVESCGEQIGDRGIALRENGNTVLVYHLTMTEDAGWSAGSRYIAGVEDWIAQGLITEQEAYRRRFWWYYKDEVARASRRNTITWIE